MMTTLSSNGQVGIPLSIRKKLGLTTGAAFSCHIADGKIILDPIQGAQTAKLIQEEGYLALEAPPSAPEMTPRKHKRHPCQMMENQSTLHR